ncbi:GRAM domain-containing protein [Spinellus fusiger]|nr:GRAM domain-containing protein [Spinellus fusiger]
MSLPIRIHHQSHRYRDRSSSSPSPVDRSTPRRPHSIDATRHSSYQGTSPLIQSPLFHSLAVSRSEETVHRTSHSLQFPLTQSLATIATHHAQVLTSTISDKRTRRLSCSPIHNRRTEAIKNPEVSSPSIPQTPPQTQTPPQAQTQAQAQAQAQAQLQTTSILPFVSSESSGKEHRLTSSGDRAALCAIPFASDERDRDFHLLFRSVPENDPLLENYKCALQKDILLQGHVYITENHVCFYANIFGWVTNLVVAFSDMTHIEKRMTAMIIPNAIHISTDSAKYVFASFLSRDVAYDQIVQLWQIHKHGQMLHSYTDPGCTYEENGIEDMEDMEDREGEGRRQTQAKSRCAPYPQCPCCEDQVHYSQVALHETYSGTVESMYSILFDSDFMEQYLTSVKKCHGLELGTWKHGLRQNNGRQQNNAAFSFKEEQIYCKFPYYISIITTLQLEPCLPSGYIKLRTCITKAKNTKVTVLVSFELETQQDCMEKLRNITGQQPCTPTPTPTPTPERHFLLWCLYSLRSLVIGLGHCLTFRQLATVCCVVAIVTNAFLVRMLVTRRIHLDAYWLPWQPLLEQEAGLNVWGLEDLQAHVDSLQKRMDALKQEDEVSVFLV